LNCPPSGTGPAQASTSSCGGSGCARGALAVSVTAAGGTGLTTELVISAEGFGWSMMLSMPELDVQPDRAAQASAMADTTKEREGEERMGTRTQNKWAATLSRVIAQVRLPAKTESKVYESANARCSN